ncbi:hypothetical protein F5051DRAFT_71155 [Lentinula edodes]|uniref:Uncharacterized protein n=1 Tax=Lentinula lateritia TaxID=40482 RepID=A0A9W9A5T7_9AGAR|nr:hypothetical protein F5051DRAFT_71155 [Lentinula edodes]KAJ3895654.1 hypothetical protein GG344DRAFT_72841 [Lentinula edodes]KAJ4475225.1 hypothetical protein C8J55DRAFT_562211 [Lentinula edodes]
MTESYISPSDVAQYHSSQDRVRNWITAHADHVFTSPNIPPSELDDQDALSSPPSDVESSHSIPPRLKLRYPDGRESPIPHTTNSSSSTGRNSRSRSNPQPNSSRQRSKLATAPSSSPILISDPRREREKLRSHSPEEIQIFPSASDEIPPVPLSSHHSRSRSLPRDAFSPSRNHDPMPNSSYGATPVMQMQTEMSPPVIPLLQSPGPYAGFARTQPAPAPWHPYTNAVRTGPMMPPSREHFKHNPPSIVYAPSNNSRTNYHPPAILSYRPTAGPNRIFYSHSVPPAQAQIANAGYPSVHGSYAPQEERVHHHKRSSELRHSSSHHRDRSVGSAKSGKSGKSSKSKDTTSRRHGRDRSRSLPLEQEYPPNPPSEHYRHPHHHRPRPPSPTGSHGSGSTYYVLPTARQKVHVLRSPDTLYTATTTTQSPTTPISPTGSIKKPFLQRLLGGFAERFSSSGSSKGSLRRRHSTGTRPPDPVSGH